MKNVFTLSLFTLLTVYLSFAQGFEPPAGSTYNIDSTEITLPSAYLDANYLDSIIFDVPESFTVELGGQSLDLPFNFAQITGVATPSGMAYDCSVMSCYFEANTSGGVVLSGIPTETGMYELALSAAVSINGAPLGINLDVDFNIPYTGGNVLLDLALNGDYSVLNDVIPTFFINVEPALSGCIDTLACNFHQYASIDDGICEYADNTICEACSGEVNGTGVIIINNDTDGDLICDDVDNCVDVSNPDQLDSDADGFGDLCDSEDNMSLEEYTKNLPILIKMIDILGTEHAVHLKGNLMFYIYSDGSVKKQIRY